MIKKDIQKIIFDVVEGFKKRDGFEKINAENILIERPREKTHGDYATNIAFIIAKQISKNPIEIAGLLKEDIEKKNFLFSKIEISSGFINFFVNKNRFERVIKNILKQGQKFGNLKIGKNQKVNVEFISANPTGPLTLGNGRGGFCGDALSNVLEKSGYKVFREYYINDTGNQINKLGHSVIGDQEAEYKGNYILDLRKKNKSSDVEKAGSQAAKEILNKMIKPSVKKMGVRFDTWFSEKTLYKSSEVDKAIKYLSKKGFTYESEGALWFKSKELGDDKDRVLIRADGVKTYFASDIAYLRNKFKRGFKKIVMFLGADHYGYIPRLKASAKAFGYKDNSINDIVMQLVRLFEDGKEVRMSKRSGIYVTIDELIEEVGLDIARFFFLSVGPDTHMNFNMDLAKEKSEKNPVLKVQYAYARICSILKKANVNKILNPDLSLLVEPIEIELMSELAKFPEIIEDTANDFQVQRLAQYAVDLSDLFHKFYEKCTVISDAKGLSKSRLALVSAVKIVLKNTLELIGVSAPEKM